LDARRTKGWVNLYYGPWRPALDWNTPAGKTLKSLVTALPKKFKFEITVFGSAPLQLALERRFLSADVDIFSNDDFSDIIQELGLAKGQGRPYIEQNRPAVFRTAPDWQQRAFTTKIGNVFLCFPHPIDLLVAKLHRLDRKDLAAFKLVQSKTGFPKENDLILALQSAVDLFRPALPGEIEPGDIFENTRRVWRELFGKSIDVQKRIIQPALEERAKAYGSAVPARKKQLACLRPPTNRRRRA
jgi:hypothetical protein